MNKYSKPEFDEGILGLSPFLQSLTIKVNKVPFQGNYRKVGDTFEQIIGKVEYDPVCKVYVNPGKRKHMAGMKDRSKGLLLWLMYDVDSGCDYIWLNKKRYMEETGISSINTFKAALNDLIRYGFIQPTVVKEVYWINPVFFFNGNRITKFPKNVKVREL